MSRHRDKRRATGAPTPLDGRLGDVREAMRAADRRFLADGAAAGWLVPAPQGLPAAGLRIRRLAVKLFILLALYGAFIEFSWVAYKTQHPGLAAHSLVIVELSHRLADWLQGEIAEAYRAGSRI